MQSQVLQIKFLSKSKMEFSWIIFFSLTRSAFKNIF